MAATRILMVCMGNICRSPTAEAVLRAKLKAAGLARAVVPTGIAWRRWARLFSSIAISQSKRT